VNKGKRSRASGYIPIIERGTVKSRGAYSSCRLMFNRPYLLATSSIGLWHGMDDDICLRCETRTDGAAYFSEFCRRSEAETRLRLGNAWGLSSANVTSAPSLVPLSREAVMLNEIEKELRRYSLALGHSRVQRRASR
jgi:hypothetical protein